MSFDIEGIASGWPWPRLVPYYDLYKLCRGNWRYRIGSAEVGFDVEWHIGGDGVARFSMTDQITLDRHEHQFPISRLIAQCSPYLSPEIKHDVQGALHLPLSKYVYDALVPILDRAPAPSPDDAMHLTKQIEALHQTIQNQEQLMKSYAGQGALFGEMMEELASLRKERDEARRILAERDATTMAARAQALVPMVQEETAKLRRRGKQLRAVGGVVLDHGKDLVARTVAALFWRN